MKKNLFLLLLVFVCFSCSKEEDTIQQATIEYDIVAEGIFSDSEIVAQQTVITNFHDWEVFLNHFPNLEVDFETYNYILVFDKIKSSSGYHLELDIAEMNDTSILVTVSYKEYTEENVLTILTKPYIIARIEKTNNPIIFNSLLEQ